jgi:hypothetical protein
VGATAPAPAVGQQQASADHGQHDQPQPDLTGPIRRLRPLVPAACGNAGRSLRGRVLVDPLFGGACRRRPRQSPLGAGPDDPVGLEPTGALKVPDCRLGHRAKPPIDRARMGARRTQLTLQRAHPLRAMQAIAPRTARQQNRLT